MDLRYHGYWSENNMHNSLWVRRTEEARRKAIYAKRLYNSNIDVGTATADQYYEMIEARERYERLRNWNREQPPGEPFSDEAFRKFWADNLPWFEEARNQ